MVHKFSSPARMSLTKLPLGRNNSVMTSLFPPRESLVVTSPLGTGNSRTFFLRCERLDLAWLKNRISAASEGKTFHRFLHLRFPDFVKKKNMELRRINYTYRTVLNYSLSYADTFGEFSDARRVLQFLKWDLFVFSHARKIWSDSRDQHFLCDKT